MTMVSAGRRPAGGAIVGVLLAAFFSPALAAPAPEIPDTFKNLKVLPKDIKKGELVGVMRMFAGALGVRCAYCHVGEDGKPLSTFDFVSDEKTTKRAARDMIRMADTINKKYIAKADLGRTERMQINCVTCHHGLTRPEQLQTILTRTTNEKGIDAALDEYRALRKKYYGGAQYDFGPVSLNMLAERLMRDNKPADAIKAAELNAELHPEDTFAQSGLGDFYAKAGNKPKAIEAMQRALSVDPANDYARKRLDALQKEEPAKP
ncbi:MAG TPA: c-type cytochrome [Verrucomicrobiae bacterium]|nr:c-type cytochrome [Verrucomicrobiae bacterium]